MYAKYIRLTIVFKNSFLVVTVTLKSTQSDNISNLELTNDWLTTANQENVKDSKISELFYVILLWIVVLLLMTLFVCRKRLKKICLNRRHFERNQNRNSNQSSRFFSTMRMPQSHHIPTSHNGRNKLKSRITQNIRSIESLWRSKFSDQISILKTKWSTFSSSKSRLTSSN